MRALSLRQPARVGLAAITLVLALFVVRRLWRFAVAPTVMDFTHYWNAARLAVEGRAAEAYAVHLSPFGEVLPLAYPPSYLLAIAPLALAGLVPALIAWLAVTGSLYLAVTRRHAGVALAHPPAAYNAVVGQNGFMFAAAILFGAAAVRRRSWLGGAVLGLVTLKPQLAPAVVVALVAGRHWRALIAMVATALALNLVAVAAFGLAAFEGFVRNLSGQLDLLQSGQWEWTLVASPYGFVRWFGAGNALAWAVQSAAALAAIAAVWAAWRGDWPGKVAVLAAAVLLQSPYLFTYDAVLLAAPIALLGATRPAVAVAAWLLTVPPFAMAVGPYSGPNSVPLAAMLCLAALCWPARGLRGRTAPPLGEAVRRGEAGLVRKRLQ